MQIFAKLSDGKIVAFEVLKSERMIDIKKKIQEKIGLDPDDQILIYQGRIMEDDKSIDEYQICDQSVINIARWRFDKIHIFAKLMNGTTVIFEVQKSERIIDIKKKIQYKAGLNPDEQILVYQGGILEDDKIVGECGITDKSVVDIVSRLRGKKIFVNLMNGKSVALEVQQTDKIRNIKMKMQEKLGWHPDEQTLIYQGGILEDDKTVGKYEIYEKSVINFVVRSRCEMQIFAKLINGKTVALEVQKSERIIEVKRKIQEKTGLSEDEQILVYQEGILEDDKTVDEYQICEKSVINVVSRSRGMKIFVKLMNGKLVALEVQKSERMIDIKKKIQEKTGLHPDEQILIYQGGILEDDDKSIDEYEICEKSVIDIDARLRLQIIVKTVHDKTIALEIQKSEKIIDIKRKIIEKLGLQPNGKQLSYQDRILDDQKKIGEYQIRNRSVINIA